MSVPRPFTVKVDRRERTVVVAPSGELDIATIGEVRAAIAASPATVDHLVLDLSGVSFIDTSGMSLVLEQHQAAEAAGRRYTLVRGPALVERVFEVSGLQARLPFAETLTDALADDLASG